MPVLGRILGIETSCDETGVAVYAPGEGVLAESLYSQIAAHQPYGGVVPELAARDHVRKLAPLVEATLAKLNTPVGERPVEGIAYTAGPGLVGALLVGAGFARSLAYAWNIPAVGVHHLEGHLLAPLLVEPKPQIPFLALLVTGGHTEIIEVRALGQYRQWGATRDDAVGEAFDKTAKLLGLSYPGGPAVERLAREGQSGVLTLPRPMRNEPGFDFSFSGLKTAVRYAVRDQVAAPADIARAFEEAVVDSLISKTRRVLEKTGHRQLVVVGGVAANQRIRGAFSTLMSERGGEAFFPPLAWCTDNGAMIAHVGSLRLVAGERQDLSFSVRSRWPLEELTSITSSTSTETKQMSKVL